MTTLAIQPMHVAAAARIMREAVKDKSYRAFPLGLEAARYIRWKKNEWGATEATIRDYEAALARTAIFHADLELSDFNPPVGTERLRECWSHYWGDAEPRTRAKIRSIWVDFFDWAIRERGLHGNPARALASPKRRDVKRDPFDAKFVEVAVARQTYPADRLGIRLIVQYGLRRSELAGVQLRDFDASRARLVVTGKGGHVRLIPIVDPAFWLELETFLLEQGLGPDSFLMYRQDSRKMRCPLHEATETLDLPGRRGAVERVGYRWVQRRWHDKGLVPRSMHTWWYRCLANAGLVAEGVESGQNMHRGRHTIATEILRRTGNPAAAQKLLGHADVSTTIRSYAQFNDADLERTLREVHEAQEQERER